MTTIFFGPLRAAADGGQGGSGQTAAKPVAPVFCSVIVVCHVLDRRRVTKP
ncbi:hypothetical protein [Methylobacterium sp. 17Sr1-1]|uniref:hypothetical protein n=1 Tax=Methylobacterium sp. 17Sr1-1 TaxID=2202826 RepID=UPI0013A569EF|nr:hypothetical protein [Methylobacterium sp. 17Sr1-1]